jgi:hypothetical protein
MLVGIDLLLLVASPDMMQGCFCRRVPAYDAVRERESCGSHPPRKKLLGGISYEAENPEFSRRKLAYEPILTTELEPKGATSKS